MATEKIYVGMPYTVRLNTGETLSGGSSPTVGYKKPDGTTGTIVATTSTTELVAAIPATTNNDAGTWTFQGSYIFSGDSAASYTESVTLNVHNLWK
jgi:hypothetical protein